MRDEEREVVAIASLTFMEAVLLEMGLEELEMPKDSSTARIV